MDQLEDEAFEIVVLGEGRAVKDAVCERGNVNTCEGVGRAGVAADGEKAGILNAELEDVRKVAWNIVSLL